MGDVFVWEGGAYRSFPEIEIKGILQELAEGMGLQVTPKLIKDTFESLQYKTVSSTNKDPYILPVSNGILYLDQLRGGKMRFEPYKDGEAPPLSALRVAYDPLATCEPFITHLEETVEEPDKDIDVIQEFFGFTLFKEQKFAKSMVWVGPGRDGKSVVANVLI
jgi:phage/plasmid-associated DNA primase